MKFENINLLPVNLNNLQGIPDQLIDSLRAYENVFLELDFLDQIFEVRAIRDIIIEIDEYCKEGKIFGFHYTRNCTEIVARSGLTCRTGEEIRKSFLENFGNHFSREEIRTISDIWNKDFDKQQQNYRDNRIFFNFTTVALSTFGAETLLTHCGGEQVYMPLLEQSVIVEKLKQIGTPLILKCVLNPNQIKTFFEYSWGRIAASTFHCSINPNAVRFDQDGYQFIDVESKDIELINFDYEKNYRNI